MHGAGGHGFQACEEVDDAAKIGSERRAFFRGSGTRKLAVSWKEMYWQRGNGEVASGQRDPGLRLSPESASVILIEWGRLCGTVK